MILHNYPTPYRMPLFDELARDVDLDVWFCAQQETSRRWSSNPTLDRGSSRILPVRVLAGFFLNWSLPVELARLEADVVVLAEDVPMILSSVLTVVFCRLRRLPLVVWSEHVTEAPLAMRRLTLGRRVLRRLKHWSYRRIRLGILRQADVVLAMSGAASEHELLSLISGVPVVGGPQIVPVSQMPVDPGIEPSLQPRFLFLGYLRPEKNVDNLINAFAQLEPGCAQLIIGGEGPELQALRARAEGIAGIQFAGYLDGAAKARELTLATALVLPSTYEPWGLVVNESLYVGTPVVVSSRAGAAELVSPGVNGFVFDVSTGEVELGVILAGLARDAELRARLSRGARAADKSRLYDVGIGCAHVLAGIRMAASRAR